MLLSKMEQEYEPGNKPKFPPQPVPRMGPPPPGMAQPNGRPFTPNKRAIVAPAPQPMPQRMAPYGKPPPPQQAPPPPIASKHDPERRTPVQNIRIPSPQPRKPEVARPAPANRIPPRPSDNDLYAEDVQPKTARDVEIEMANQGPRPAPVVPAPPVGRPMSVAEKKEARRAKLLNNALSEARERRSRETPVSRPATVANGDKGEVKDRTRKKNDSRKSLSPLDRSADPKPDQWASTRRDRRNKKYRDEGDSGDSSTNLLSDSSSPEMASRDPSMMSIQEILRMKVQARTSHRRAKKILSA